MTKEEAKDYKELYDATNGEVSWGRFRFIMRIFTRPDIKLLTYDVLIKA